MSNQFVFLKSFTTEIEAQIVKGRLESEGLLVEMRDHNLVSADWFYSNAVGGVKLFVLKSSLADARKILDEPIESSQVAESGVIWELCPKCGSNDVEYFADSRITWITCLLFGLPLFFPKRKLHCLNCDNWWPFLKDKDNSNDR